MPNDFDAVVPHVRKGFLKAARRQIASPPRISIVLHGTMDTNVDTLLKESHNMPSSLREYFHKNGSHSSKGSGFFWFTRDIDIASDYTSFGFQRWQCRLSDNNVRMRANSPVEGTVVLFAVLEDHLVNDPNLRDFSPLNAVTQSPDSTRFLSGSQRSIRNIFTSARPMMMRTLTSILTTMKITK